MFTDYDHWIMILLFLGGIPFLIYGAYWIKKRSWMWSPFRTNLLEDDELEEETITFKPRDFSKNVKRMQEIARNEENYVPSRKLFREEILAVKEELESNR
jgi:hypothetical protein